jgi:hypothetical protein
MIQIHVLNFLVMMTPHVLGQVFNTSTEYLQSTDSSAADYYEWADEGIWQVIGLDDFDPD